jgi:hypothetical protein
MIKSLIIISLALCISLQAGNGEAYMKLSGQHYRIFKKSLPLDDALKQEFNKHMKAQGTQKQLLIQSAKKNDPKLVELLKELNAKRKVMQAVKNKANTLAVGQANNAILTHLINVTRTQVDQRELYNAWVEKVVEVNQWCLKLCADKTPDDESAYAEIQSQRKQLLKAE